VPASKTGRVNGYFGYYSSVSDTGSSHSSSTFSLPLSVAWSKVVGTSGVDNPRWRDQIRLGQNATTALSGNNVKVSGSNFATVYYKYFTQGDPPSLYPQANVVSEAYGYLPYVPNYSQLVPSSIVSDVSNRCIRKFISKANEILSSENLTGRSIKHLKHDLHTIANPMSGIRGQIQKYLTQVEKSGSARLNKSHLLKNIRSAYLEFTFGISPFVTDITDILKDVGRTQYPAVPIQSSATDSYFGQTSDFQSYLGLLGTVVSPCQITSTYSIRIKGAIRTDVGNDGSIGILQDLRLLPRDWLPNLVSILPYDWMANYFTNINDVVDSYCFPFSNLAWAQKTTRTVTKTIYGSPYKLLAPPSLPNGSHYVQTPVFTGIGGNQVIETTDMVRSILIPNDLVASLQVKIPSSPRQWVNMMAVFQPRIFKILRSLT